MGYEILEHTADIKFRATGKTLEDAFSESVKAFSTVVGDGEKGHVAHSVDVESENLEALLFDFMDELIFLQDTEGVIVCEAENMEIEDREHGYRLKADILTDTLSPGGDYLDIKGPTYNEMKVEHESTTGEDEPAKSEWVIETVLDI